MPQPTSKNPLTIADRTELEYLLNRPNLVEAISNHDARLLDDLQCLLDEKRRELRGQVLATRD